MDLEKAICFVRLNGNAFEKARLNHTLGLEFDKDAVSQGFQAIQNPDGGFPFSDRKGFPSTLSNTTMALQTLIAMGMRDSEPVRMGFEYLAKSRNERGFWEENPKILPLDPPFWDLPGDMETSIWLTAACADLLLRAGHHVPNETIEFLMSKQNEDGRFDGYYHTTWIALSIFGEHGMRHNGVFLKAMKYLEDADMSDWDTSSLAWCLDCVNTNNSYDINTLKDKIIEGLSGTQEPDGGWPSDGGEALRVRDTNSVLAAMYNGAENKQ